jgi:hypothetical protein
MGDSVSIETINQWIEELKEEQAINRAECGEARRRAIALHKKVDAADELIALLTQLKELP